MTSPDEPHHPFGHYAPSGAVARLINVTRRTTDSWFSRRMSFALRRLAIRKLAGAPVDMEALGARMRLFPYNNVCEKRILFTPQHFDPDELAHLRARLREGFVFLDIGANIGGYTLHVAAEAGPTARVLAVEPQPEIYQRLVRNIRFNPFPTVKAVACAVADKDGELTLFISDDNRGESSVKIMAANGGSKQVTVPSRRLLTLIEEQGYTRVDAAKLDTEGAEDLILETFFAEAPDTLWPGLLILERGTSRWHIDLPALLRSKGYAVVAETRNNVIFERKG